MTPEPSNHDTIAAIATPMGQAGIGIIRLSGPQAAEIAKKIFLPKRPVKDYQNRQLYLGHLIDPPSGCMIDQVLVSFMKAPHSYTREDVVEINSHSGYLILSKILQTVLAEGARLAKPGEFTFRAFIHGRIDLTQAEAVIDLINARSERGLQLASRQIDGHLKTEIDLLRKKGIEILAHLEVAIDFPEEEQEILSKKDLIEQIEKELLSHTEKILAAHSQRKIWMDGINTVIVGRVNAGKSSLLNRLLNEERAIVTPIPGTTRDIIESTIYIDGIPLRLIDTAGFRSVKGEVEKIGIRLTEQKMARADLSLIVVDQSRPLNQYDLNLIRRSEKNRSLIVLNKIDLPSALDKERHNKIFNGFQVIRISALTGEGIYNLRTAIVRMILSGCADTVPSDLIPNLRHKAALAEAFQCYQNAVRNLKEDLPTEIIAVDLKGGLDALGEIIGETTSEEILDKIFSQFCLGK
ncbi:MAG: tRNA uridine-5-carboxymethylaminomethyl(34) synthesis GTPase MnmE [Pseudomonadota bacterium]